VAWVRVLVVVGIYVVVALLASTLLGRTNRDLKDVKGRATKPVLIVGAVANLLVLAATLVFLVRVDGRPLSTLGLGLSVRDMSFGGTAVAALAASATALVMALRHFGLLRVRVRRVRDRPGWLLATAAVLVVVALQEEVLYRGYVTVNLIDRGWAVVLLVSTLLFTAIHVLTNRVSLAQVASWLVGGVLLGCVYLVTGSIWIAAAIHFAIDMTNVMAFDLAGDLGVVELSPPLTASRRATYRVASTALVLGTLLAFYGVHTAPHWSG